MDCTRTNAKCAENGLKSGTSMFTRAFMSKTERIGFVLGSVCGNTKRKRVDRMGRSLPKFKCPGCGSYINGAVYKGEPDNEGYKRYRKCENCGVGIVTVETITHYTKRRKRMA